MKIQKLSGGLIRHLFRLAVIVIHGMIIQKIMLFLNRLGYRVTLSTKQAVDQIDLEEIRSLDKSYLYFLISIPFANEIAKMEKGTSSLCQRIESIKNLYENGFNVAIYIKPFFEGKTSKSLPKIIEILQHFKIPVILGRLFASFPDKDKKRNRAVVSNSHVLVESENKEYFNVKDMLQRYTIVYENSFQIFDSKMK